MITNHRHDLEKRRVTRHFCTLEVIAVEALSLRLAVFCSRKLIKRKDDCDLSSVSQFHLAVQTASFLFVSPFALLFNPMGPSHQHVVFVILGEQRQTVQTHLPFSGSMLTRPVTKTLRSLSCILASSQNWLRCRSNRDSSLQVPSLGKVDLANSNYKGELWSI